MVYNEGNFTEPIKIFNVVYKNDKKYIQAGNFRNHFKTFNHMVSGGM